MQPGAATNRSKLTGSKASEVRIELGDMGGSDGNAAYYQDTEENVAFRQEFEDRKRKQDHVLEEIESGVGRLGDIATDMGQELTKQDKLLDEVEGNVRPAPVCVHCNVLVSDLVNEADAFATEQAGRCAAQSEPTRC